MEPTKTIEDIYTTGLKVEPTILNFTPTKVGKYPIICAELCGPYHGGMRASIIVEEESDYKDWFNKNTKTEVSL